MTKRRKPPKSGEAIDEVPSISAQGPPAKRVVSDDSQPGAVATLAAVDEQGGVVVSRRTAPRPKGRKASTYRQSAARKEDRDGQTDATGNVNPVVDGLTARPMSTAGSPVVETPPAGSQVVETTLGRTAESSPRLDMGAELPHTSRSALGRGGSVIAQRSSRVEAAESRM